MKTQLQHNDTPIDAYDQRIDIKVKDVDVIQDMLRVMRSRCIDTYGSHIGHVDNVIFLPNGSSMHLELRETWFTGLKGRWAEHRPTWVVSVPYSVIETPDAPPVDEYREIYSTPYEDIEGAVAHAYIHTFQDMLLQLADQQELVRTLREESDMEVNHG